MARQVGGSVVAVPWESAIQAGACDKRCRGFFLSLRLPRRLLPFREPLPRLRMRRAAGWGTAESGPFGDTLHARRAASASAPGIFYTATCQAISTEAISL